MLTNQLTSLLLVVIIIFIFCPFRFLKSSPQRLLMILQIWKADGIRFQKYTLFQNEKIREKNFRMKMPYSSSCQHFWRQLSGKEDLRRKQHKGKYIQRRDHSQEERNRFKCYSASSFNSLNGSLECKKGLLTGKNGHG